MDGGGFLLKWANIVSPTFDQRCKILPMCRLVSIVECSIVKENIDSIILMEPSEVERDPLK